MSGTGYEWVELLVAVPAAAREVEALLLLSLGGTSVLVTRLAFLHHQAVMCPCLHHAKLRHFFYQKELPRNVFLNGLKSMYN